MFATVTNGQGFILSQSDEDGNELPLLTTAEVLKQLEKFGFDIQYEEEPNLSGEQLTFLTNLLDLGYDAITRAKIIYPKTTRLVTIAYASNKTTDFLKFDTSVTKAKFDEELENGAIANITKMDKTLEWDWLTYTCQIEDILEANSVVHHIAERSPVLPTAEPPEMIVDDLTPVPSMPDVSTFHVYGAVEVFGDDDGDSNTETSGSISGGA